MFFETGNYVSFCIHQCFQKIHLVLNEINFKIDNKNNIIFKRIKIE